MQENCRKLAFHINSFQISLALAHRFRQPATNSFGMQFDEGRNATHIATPKTQTSLRVCDREGRRVRGRPPDLPVGRWNLY